MTIEELNNIDQTFDESQFISKVYHIFVQLLHSIMLDQLQNVKHAVGDEVYGWAEDQLNQAKEDHCRQMYDELNVSDTKITGIDMNDELFTIDVLLKSKYMDYKMDLNSGKVVSGNQNHRIQVNYLLRWTKKVDAHVQKMARKCPGCGAPININVSGQCQYCGTIYNLEDYDWILTRLEIC